MPFFWSQFPEDMHFFQHSLPKPPLAVSDLTANDSCTQEPGVYTPVITY